MANLTKHELNRIAQLEEDISSYKRIIKTLKEVKEDFKQELDQYKRERDELSEKLDKECNDNYKLEGQLHDMTKQRDSLIKDIEKQRELLKDFSKFIHRKLVACPGKKEYMDFRDRLNELGIRERE